MTWVDRGLRVIEPDIKKLCPNLVRWVVAIDPV